MNKLILLLLSFYSQNSFATQAQPVPVPEDQGLTPQINIAGVGVATLVLDKTKAGVNFSDSALVVGAAQRLSDGKGVGSAGLGWLTLDETNQGLGTQLFLNQAFLDFQDEKFELLIGRSDNPITHAVDFPLIREDDLITLTNPMNPYSNGVNAEEHRYSNVISATFNQGLKYFENFHAQHLINSAAIGSTSVNEGGINAFGATVEMLGTPGMDAFSGMPSFGFGYEHFTLPNGGLHLAYAGGVFNLRESVVHRWDLRFQAIANWGSDKRSLLTMNDSFQANSDTVTAGVRYLYSPFGQTGYQLSLTCAYKTYPDVAAKSYGGTFTGVKRLGNGFNLVAQYLGQWRNSVLAAVQSSSVVYEQVFELGFVFSFDSTINQHLAPRRSILNQRYEYLSN